MCSVSVKCTKQMEKWELDQVLHFFITLVWSLSNIRTQTICCMGLKYLILPRGRQHMPPLHVIQPRRAETDCNMKYAGQRGVASLVDVKMTGQPIQSKKVGFTVHKSQPWIVNTTQMKQSFSFKVRHNQTFNIWQLFSDKNVWKCGIGYNLRDSCYSCCFRHFRYIPPTSAKQPQMWQHLMFFNYSHVSNNLLY